MQTNIFTKWFSALFNKRTGVFLFFILIASVVWLINRLQEDYHAPLSFNICVYNGQSHKSSYLCSDEPVSVMARASGFKIIGRRLKKSSVWIDIKDQRVHKAGLRHYLLTTTLKNNIDQLLGIKVESYMRDTIFFHTVDKAPIPDDGEGHRPLTLRQRQGTVKE